MTIAMRVVDTSAWIEWLTGSQLGKRLTTQFPDKPQFVVPTIVELELSKWLMREIGEERADQVLAYTLKCAVVPLDTTIALLAADLHREHKRATADAIVYATAQSQQAQLLTCDAQFKNLQDGIFFRRRPQDRSRHAVLIGAISDRPGFLPLRHQSTWCNLLFNCERVLAEILRTRYVRLAQATARALSVG